MLPGITKDTGVFSNTHYLHNYLRCLPFPIFKPSSPFSFLLLRYSLLAIAMATKAVMRYPIRMTSEKAALIFNTTSRRTLTSYRPIPLKPLCAQIKPAFSRLKLQQSFRRSYADISPPPRPRRRAGFFRWTWRLVYVSAIGGAAYLAYTIYDLRTPPEQAEPDPTKKTLVILGT